MVTCNVITPQLFWFKRIRHNLVAMWIIYIFVNIGMWFERFVIIVSSLSRDFLPSSWAYFRPTPIDVLTFVGSFGLFLTLVLLFIRFLPMVAMAEVKTVMPAISPHGVPLRSVGDYHGDIHTPRGPKGVQP
jgi:molybdopterin-containing oxidoreductase family membrane subunit